MPSLLDIRRRIRAVKSTQQITKAMKMVAASKLRRAQERIQQARPFATQMQRVLNSLASRVDPGGAPAARRAAGAARRRPRAAVRDHRRPRPVRQLQHQRHQGGRHVHHRAAAIARWRSGWSAGAAATTSRGAASRSRYERVNLFATLHFEDAQAIASAAIEAFVSGEVDSVYLVYNEFKSVMSAARRGRAPAADSAVRSAARRSRRDAAPPDGVVWTICTSRRRRSCSRT